MNFTGDDDAVSIPVRIRTKAIVSTILQLTETDGYDAKQIYWMKKSIKTAYCINFFTIFAACFLSNLQQNAG